MRESPSKATNKKNNKNAVNKYLLICAILFQLARRAIIAIIPIVLITCLWQYLSGNVTKKSDAAKTEIAQYYNPSSPGYSIPKTSYDDGTISIDEIYIETFHDKPRIRLNNIAKKDYEEVYINIRYLVYGANNESLGEGYIVARNYGGSSLYLTTNTMPVDYLPTRVELTSVTTYPTSYNMDTGENYASSVEEKSDSGLYLTKTGWQSFAGRFVIVFIVFAVIWLIGLLGKKSN